MSPHSKRRALLWLLALWFLGTVLWVFIVQVRRLDKMRDHWRDKVARASVPAPERTGGPALLKALIATRYPAAFSKETREFERVGLLRQWVAETADWAGDVCRLDEEAGFRFFERDAPDLFAAFLDDRGGVLCGGRAWALRRLYDMLGYEAYTYDMGVPGATTHTVVLVRVTHGDARVLTVQDPTYDVTFTRADGAPLDFIEMLTLLKKRRLDDVRALEGKAGESDFLAPAGYVVPGNSPFLAANARPAAVLPDGRLKYRIRHAYASAGEASRQPPVGALLEKRFGSTDPRYLFLLPISVMGLPEGAGPIVRQAEEIPAGAD